MPTAWGGGGEGVVDNGGLGDLVETVELECGDSTLQRLPMCRVLSKDYLCVGYFQKITYV